MQRLVLRHRPGAGDWVFEVQRVKTNGAKSASPVIVEDPLALKLPGTGQRLGAELTWYLENYLDYPFGGSATRAERVQSALSEWGERAFDALFGHGQARDFYRDATRDGHTALHLQIASDDPRVLSWPWEALRDPQVGNLAQHCRIERQLDSTGDPLPLPQNLSREQVNILLVTARPYRNDVAYRSISRPLVELIQSEKLPASVKVLRPPTFDQLRRELQDNPGKYHIVHFDGHGGFGSAGASDAGRFKGPQGELVFEKDDGSDDPVTAKKLSELLREHRIPIAVLNACQSAMLNEQADDAFASVATALLKAGVRSVVAMGYSLYVSGARQFLPAFYRGLFRSGSTAEAVRAGRQEMFANPQRRGDIELQDWLVPVLYQQGALALDFAGRAGAEQVDTSSGVPEEARVEPGHAPHGVIGRDSIVLELERASRGVQPALLLHGLSGVGKTTLARGYIQWLVHTQGLPGKVIWQNLTDVRSFDYLRNRLVEELFGTNAMALPDVQKWTALEQALHQQALLIVWDNFESASGAADVGDAVEAMPAADLQMLVQFLVKLHGGKTKVLITSRSDEQWLGTEMCRRLPLGGLQGEERQALAQAILADQGLRLDAKDQDTADLIDSLHGHPLMMRAILPRLGGTGAKRLLQELERYVPQQDSNDPSEQRLYATLRFVEEGMPAALRPLLLPIGLHERYVDADLLACMAKHAEQLYTAEQAQQALGLLERAGLVQCQGRRVYEMHPAFERYARTQGERLVVPAQDRESWQRAFVELMAALAGHYTPRELHLQRLVFQFFGGSFERSLNIAECEADLKNSGVLMQALAVYALNRRNLPLAESRFEAYAAICERRGRDDLAAAPYHQLGRVAQERRDFAAAEAWCRKSLEIDKRLGNEHGVARSYHQLGRVAEERRDFAAAEAWYRKTLEIEERLGNERGAVITYHQLGIVTQKRLDFAAAKGWYRKSLEIEERLSNEHGAANTYHQLGMVAQQQRDFAAAEAWYRKSLEINERLGNEHREAGTYHQLARVAEEQHNLAAAEAWYRKSLEINERLGNKHDAASTYHQLGVVAQERRDFAAAEAWYRKSQAINERSGNEHGAASTYHQLGIVAQQQRDFAVAETWYRKSLEIKERFGDEYGAAGNYLQLGRVAEEQNDLATAKVRYLKALAFFEQTGDEHNAAIVRHSLQRLQMTIAGKASSWWRWLTRFKFFRRWNR